MEKINFSGGEPFIEGRQGSFLGEMVRYCKEELNLSVSIVSNGSLIRENWFKSYGNTTINAKLFSHFNLNLRNDQSRNPTC